MTIYECDRKDCRKQQQNPLQITLDGYYPDNAGGIMIPESSRHFEFCCHDCFVRWMKAAMELENYK